MADTDTGPAPGAPAPPSGTPEQPADVRGAPGGLWGLLVRHQALVVPTVALLIAFGIGAILIRAQGVNPTYAYVSLFQAALGTPDGLTRTLQKTTPLILTGLAVVVPLRVGLFNIGAQGQLIFGAIGAAWVGYAARDLGVLALVLGLVVGVLAGAMWASIAGLLKTTRGVHEVISTIMLNSIAAGIVDYLINYPLKEQGQPIPRTPLVGESAMIPALGVVPLGFPLALLIALAVAWMLKRTTTGFRFDTVGKNRFAAGYAGIGYGRVVLLAMAMAGGLAGLGGAVETLGVTHRFESSFGGTLGFDGITIALLARSNPLGTIPAALLVGILRSGAPTLQFDTGIQPEVVDVLLAVTLLLVSIPILARLLFRGYAKKGTALASSWGN
jgi:simple sugar transport system permease protein